MRIGSYTDLIKKMLGVYFAFLLLVIAINIIIDPYFCYRMTDNSKYFSWNQAVSPTWKYGMTKQYEGYDAVWVGSSVSSHVNEQYVNKNMNVNCAMAVQASGRPNIYQRFIKNIQKKNDIKYVFYELVPTHWCFPAIGTEFDIEQYVEKYVWTDSLLDDGDYLISRTTTSESLYIIKGMLSEKIKTRSEENNVEIVETSNTVVNGGLETYYSTKIMAPRIYANNSNYGLASSSYMDHLQAGLDNINLYVKPLIESNSNIEFVFVIPPTGVMVMKCFEEAGCLEEYICLTEELYKELLSYPNTRIVAGNLNSAYNTNTENYMDDGHYEPFGATMLVDYIVNGEYDITLENIKSRSDEYRFMVENFEWPFLKINFVGDRVIELQTKLVEKGYDVQVSGIYDTATEEAVKKLQEENGIEVTGIAFEDTLELLNT